MEEILLTPLLSVDSKSALLFFPLFYNSRFLKNYNYRLNFTCSIFSRVFFFKDFYFLFFLTLTDKPKTSWHGHNTKELSAVRKCARAHPHHHTQILTTSRTLSSILIFFFFLKGFLTFRRFLFCLVVVGGRMYPITHRWWNFLFFCVCVELTI